MSEPRKLDKNRPFGEVYGSDDGAKYEQFGIMFDGLGNELPGYDHLEIPPDDGPKVIVVQDEKAQEIIAGLETELHLLKQVNRKLDEQMENAVGRQDDLQAEVDRQSAEIADLKTEIQRLKQIEAEYEKVKAGADAGGGKGQKGKTPAGDDGGKQMGVQDLLGGGA